MRFNMHDEIINNGRYITIPMALLTNDKYACLDNTARLIYGALLSRLNLSRLNHWVDEDGNLYCKMTVNELAELFHNSKGNISKKLAALEKAGLLERKKLGWGNADLLFLHKVEVMDDDDEQLPCRNSNARISSDIQASDFSLCSQKVSSRSENVSNARIDVSAEKPIYKTKKQDRNIKSYNNNSDSYLSDPTPAAAAVGITQEAQNAVTAFLRTTGLSSQTIKSLIYKYGIARIREVIAILQCQTTLIRNKAGFVYSALRDNYQMSVSQIKHSFMHNSSEAVEDTAAYSANTPDGDCDSGDSDTSDHKIKYSISVPPKVEKVNVESPEIRDHIRHFIEITYASRGKLFYGMQDWLDTHGFILQNGMVIHGGEGAIC